MTTRQRLEENGFNINTLILIISIIGAVVTTIFFFAPLRTLPDDMSGIQKDVRHMQQTQAVQTEALKMLAEIAKDSRDIRRDFDRHSIHSDARHSQHERELENIRATLNKLRPD